MILNDLTIKELGDSLVTVGWDEKRVQPASYDITLHSVFAKYTAPEIDIRNRKSYGVDEFEADSFDLEPGGFIIAASAEVFDFPIDLSGDIKGKSSIGRLGLMVHPVAGWIDPGFNGRLSLPITNLSSSTVTIRPGDAVAQVAFSRMENPAGVSYGDKGDAKYQGVVDSVVSRMHENYAR